MHRSCVISVFIFLPPPFFFVFLPRFLGINGKPRLLFRVHIYIYINWFSLLSSSWVDLAVNNVCVVQFPCKSGSSFSLSLSQEREGERVLNDYDFFNRNKFYLRSMKELDTERFSC